MQFDALLHNLKQAGPVVRRPHSWARVAAGVCGQVFANSARLRIVEFVINTECNSNCLMCYATRYNKPGRDKITPAGVKDIWRQAEKRGAFIAALEGGEAILHEQFYDFLSALDPFRNIVVLVSNSIAMDTARIMELKRRGLSMLHLSLNSPEPGENDRIRGYPGHFDKVMACVESAKACKLPVCFSSILQHDNRDGFVRIVELAERLGIGVSGALIVTMGRNAGMMNQRLVQEDREWLLQLLKRKGNVLRFDWNNNLSNRYECPAGYEKVAVSVYGEVMACVCNHLSFGNALEEPLSVILDRMREFRLFKERNPSCLASFDTEYLREYLDPIADSDSYPVSIFEHPTHPLPKPAGGVPCER